MYDSEGEAREHCFTYHGFKVPETYFSSIPEKFRQDSEYVTDTSSPAISWVRYIVGAEGTGALWDIDVYE